MKNCFFSGLSVLLVNMTYAQAVSVEKSVLNTNLYEVFVSGKVLLKSGRTEESLLNYDTEKQRILFKQGEQVMELTGLENVDTVYIAERKFVPIENSFYEAVPGTTPIALYITYTNKRKPVVSSIDHTGTSKQTGDKASNNVASAYLSRPNQINYSAEVLTHYWLKRGNSFYKANNENQLTKVFPFRDNTVIKDYLKANPVDFAKPEEVAKLVVYCNSLTK